MGWGRIQGSRLWWTAGQCLTLRNRHFDSKEKGMDKRHLEAGLLWSGLSRTTSWSSFTCWLSWVSYMFNLRLAKEVFLACLCCLVYISSAPSYLTGGALLATLSPHVERSHWLIWPTPSTRLMGPAHASSLPFEIYVPTRSAINHRTCTVGSKLQQEAKSRAIHYRGFAAISEPHPHDWLEKHQQD